MDHVAEGDFDPNNRNYVPGSLNISILDKHDIIIDEETADLTEDNVFTDMPQEYLDNSSVNITQQTENAFIADVNVSHGVDSGTFSMYSAEDNGLYIDGTYYSAEEIAKNPESFGFTKSVVRSEKDGNTYSYYSKYVENEDAYSTILSSISDDTSGISDVWSGEAILKVIEGDAADSLPARIFNNYVTGKVGDLMDDLGCKAYGGIGDMLSFGADTAKYFERMYKADGNEELQGASTVLFAIKAFNTFGGTEAALAACGIMPPASTIIGVGIEVAISYVEDYLDYCIENNMEFTLSGFIRFIIDPSGIVYEAVKSNRISGAVMTVYYLDIETDEAVLWNAEDYEQANPIYTDSQGAYAWDVPEGKWKVVCELEGYETQESEWLDVPPVQTEVDFSLVSYEAPSIESSEYTYDGIVVKFTKFMDVSTVTEDTLTIDAAVTYTVAPQLYNSADAYTDTFIISGDFSSVDTVTVSASSDCMSYAGTAAEAGSASTEIEKPVETTTAPVTTTTTATTTTTTTALPVTITESEEPVSDVMLGDVNGDKAVDASDASNVLAAYAIKATGGKESISEFLKV